MAYIAGIGGSPESGGSSAAGRAMLTSIGAHSPSASGMLAAWSDSQIAQDGPLTLVLDGYVYNPEDFPAPNGPASDAALLLSAIDRFGIEDALARVNGDFALAVHDQRSGELRLARDRFGIRPLYHTIRERTDNRDRPAAFASRPKALLALPWVPRDPDPAFLLAAAATHYRIPDTDPVRSPFAAIAQVPAGHVVTLTDGIAECRRFADISANPSTEEDADAQREAYLDLLRDAVERRLAHAASPAFTLSGGLDSSAVAAMAKRITGAPQAAISSVHKDKTYDEHDEIKDIVDAGLVDWHPVEIDDPDLFPLLERMSAFHDQPIPTVTWLSHYLLAEKIREKGYESIFGGLGGDEQHAGEYDYFFYHFADLKRAGRDQTLQHEISEWIRHHDHPVFRKSAQVAERTIAMLTDPDTPGRCRVNTDLLFRYKHLLNPELGNLESLAPTYQASSDSYLSSHMRNELLFNTMPCCLRAGNRNAAHLGLEEFHPFLDHRLMGFMLALPGGRKIRDGVTKVFARETYEGLLPDATRGRIKKTGWNAPAHQWFSGNGRDALMDLVSSEPFASRGIYDPSALRSLIDEHQDIVTAQDGREDHMMVLWQIVTLEFWLRSVDAMAPADATLS